MALIKLKLESYGKPDCSGQMLGSINAIINPESYTRDYKVKYENPSIIGDSANTSFFAGMGSNELSLKKMLVDGTGVIPGLDPTQSPFSGSTSVDDYITAFGAVVYAYTGDIHSPPYVKVSWGNLKFIGVCKSLNVEYKLFNPDGTALRAYIDLILIESMDPAVKGATAANSSPDLTHRRTVKAGDTLPLMTFRIYGDSTLYTEVAKFNNLKSVNSIKPGDEIYFPHLKK